jgi:hypothetical protein
MLYLLTCTRCQCLCLRHFIVSSHLPKTCSPLFQSSAVISATAEKHNNCRKLYTVYRWVSRYRNCRLDILFFGSSAFVCVGILDFGIGDGTGRSRIKQGRERYRVRWKRKVRVKLNVVVKVRKKGYPRARQCESRKHIRG